MIDELTSHVLERAVRKRNEVEHGYVSPTLEVAEDVVELIRRTIAALRMLSPPGDGPWLFGSFLYAIGSGKKRRYTEFGGWRKPLAVFSRFPPRPWCGLVLPDDEIRATIRLAWLSETTTAELLELLLLAGTKFGMGGVGADADSCEALAQAAGLLPKPALPQAD